MSEYRDRTPALHHAPFMTVRSDRNRPHSPRAIVGRIAATAAILAAALGAGSLRTAHAEGPNAIVRDPNCLTNILDRNDDNSTAAVPLPSTFNFFGTNFGSVFINNNGNLTFDGPQSTFTPFPITTTGHMIIAPFFGDVDTRNPASGVVHYGMITLGSRPAFCVLWDKVGYFSFGVDRLNDFQLLLVDRSDRAPGDFDIEFRYDQMQWETGSASGGAGGLGGNSARVGYSNGSTTSLELPGSAINGALIDGGPNALTAGSANSAQPGVYIFPVQNGSAPTGGTIHGIITRASDGSVVGGAVVVVDSSDGTSHHLTTTNAEGLYSVTGLATGTYSVTVSPPNPLFETTVGGNTLAQNGSTEVDVALNGPRPLPGNTTVTTGRPNNSDGTPVFFWTSPAQITTHACPNGTVTFSVTVNGTQGPTGTLTETPAGSGAYAGTIPPIYPLHGPAQVTLTATCPDPTQNSTAVFSAYVDPSGTVVDQSSNAVSGATVTLLRSDTSAGPFVAVPNGSTIMSPANRNNPDTTDSLGRFGWDVLTGFYEVQASAPNCTGPGGSPAALAGPFAVPPAISGLTLTLTCTSVHAPTHLTYTGSTAGDFHDATTWSAVLTDTSQSSPAPVAGRTVSFAIGAVTCNGVTDANGVAQCTVTLPLTAGSYTVGASFAGDGSHLSSTTSSPFTVHTEEAALSYSGGTLIANGRAATLAATLLEDGTTPISGRSVTLTLGTGSSAQTCSALTGAAGLAGCTITTVNQPLGPGSVSAAFSGDSSYIPASTTASTLVFAYLSGGAFVIGDLNAATGSEVTFDSGDWRKRNLLSGGVAPDGFKGFASTLVTTPPQVGQIWTAMIGGDDDGIRPPHQVPAYMAVLVTGTITRGLHHVISGNIPAMVIVHVDPRHTTTGTVVALLAGTLPFPPPLPTDHDGDGDDHGGHHNHTV